MRSLTHTKFFKCLFSSLTLFSTIFLLPVYADSLISFYHTDPSGTPLAISDQSGTVVWRSDNKPFGEEYKVTADPQNKRTFVGKEKDKESGLHYFNARYMESTVGRFVSTDSVTPVDIETGALNFQILLEPQRQNLYSYGLNNPYRYTDPTGLVADTILDLGFVTYDLYEVSQNPTRNNFIALGFDIVGALVPFATGLGAAYKASKATKGGVKIGAKGGKGAGKGFSNKVKDQARKESGNTCVFCKTKTTNKPGPIRSEIDHAIPKSRNGNNSLKNAQNTCRTCNRRKATRTTKEFIKK